MTQILKPGQTVRTRSGQACQVKQLLGAGGQGEVYRAEWNGQDFALKWYHAHTATAAQQASLERLVSVHKAPCDKFLWPLDLASSDTAPGFGYVMKLREPRYRGLLDLMLNRIDPTFATVVHASFELVDSFFKLHADGLCYRDISFGNVCFDPQVGDVLICDNDNVTENNSPVTGILGTPDFMAPEIVRGEALPSRQTDLFSLAVLLFYLLHVSHPLQGRRLLKIRCWDLPARRKLFGTEPLFIFDPQDHSNAAVGTDIDPMGESGANALAYWPTYPQFLRDTFTRAFTRGLMDPDERVLEGEWRRVLSRMQDGLFACSQCGQENFFDPAVAPNRPCSSCQKMLRLPMRLKLAKTEVTLTQSRRLFSHHLNEKQDYEFIQPVAEVVPHPTNPSIWGLKNLTAQNWVITTTDGQTKDVEPNRSVPLAHGTRILFANSTAEMVL